MVRATKGGALMNAQRCLAILIVGIGAYCLLVPQVTDAACLISEQSACATAWTCEEECEYGNRCYSTRVIGFVFPGYTKCRSVQESETGHQDPCINSAEPVNCYQWYNCEKYLKCTNPLAVCGDECEISTYYQCGYGGLGSVHIRYSEIEDYSKPTCP